MLQVTWSVLVSRCPSFLWTVFLISPRKANTTSCLTSFTSQTGEWSRDTHVHVTVTTWQDSLGICEIRVQDHVCLQTTILRPHCLTKSERERSLSMTPLHFRSLKAVCKELKDKATSLKTVKSIKLFTWRYGSHIGVAKQWNGGHVGVPNQSCGSWTLFLWNTFFCTNTFLCASAPWVKLLCKAITIHWFALHFIKVEFSVNTLQCVLAWKWRSP